jgi:spoIIIJ-associated protein
MAAKNLEKEIKELTDELLSLLKVEADFEIIKEVKDKESIIKVEIQPKNETGLLIGRRGETLEAIQAFLRMVIKRQTGDWVKIVVNVGDWRTKQEEYLVNLAKQAAQRAKETGQDQNLYNLSPAQRRVIHLALAGEEDIETESQGEGEERYLSVKPKNK